MHVLEWEDILTLPSADVAMSPWSSSAHFFERRTCSTGQEEIREISLA